MSHLLGTNATDDIIVEKDIKNGLHVHPYNILPMELANAIYKKIIWCSHAPDEYDLEEVFVEEGQQSMRLV